MTNGEKILNGFSNATIRRCKNKDFTYIEVEQNDKWIADFNIEWWEAGCKEPTTKNDLVVECISKQAVLDLIADDDLSMGQVVRGIHALPSVIPQEPTTKENLAIDLIDREELLKAMDTWDKFGNDPNEGLIPLRTPALQDRYVPYVHYYDMVNCVKGMSSVTPIRPKGHWINQNDDYYDWYECSECGYGSEGEMQYSSEYDVRTKFCPNCGADMREVKR